MSRFALDSYEIEHIRAALEGSKGRWGSAGFDYDAQTDLLLVRIHYFRNGNLVETQLVKPGAYACCIESGDGAELQAQIARRKRNGHI